MGTRAVIQVEGINFAQVYKHWDGYPSAMVTWLENFNKDFGDDPSYKFAQLLRFAKANEETYDLDPSMKTGWGVVEYGADCGEAYKYILKRDGDVSIIQMY